MHSDFSLCLSKLFAFAYFLYLLSVLSNTYLILSQRNSIFYFSEYQNEILNENFTQWNENEKKHTS